MAIPGVGPASDGKEHESGILIRFERDFQTKGSLIYFLYPLFFLAGTNDIGQADGVGE